MLLITMSLATASMPAFAEESQDRFVGPPSRLQPRLPNETGTPREQLSALANPFSPTKKLVVASDSPSRLVDRHLNDMEMPRDLPEVKTAALLSALAQTEPLTLPQPTPENEEPPTAQAPYFDQPQLLDEGTPDEAIDTGEPLPCYVAKPMSSITANIAFPEGDLPSNVAVECAADVGTVSDTRLEYGWAQFDFEWAATCLCHRPLYFEEINAERYGYTASYVLQPVISAGHFFLTIPALPYRMTVDRPHDCIYTLGHYRPGDCVPWRASHLPLEVGAALVQVGTIAGLIVLVP